MELDLLLVDDEDPGFTRMGPGAPRRSFRPIRALADQAAVALRWALEPPKLAVPMLAAHAKAAGHSVEAILRPLHPIQRWRFRRLLSRRPRVVGITTVAMFEYSSVARICAEVRSRSPGSLIVLGGHGAREYAEMRALADLTITQHGEGALCRVLDGLKRGRGLEEIDGVSLGDDGHPVMEGSVRYEGIGREAYPDWSLASSGRRRFPIEASRGCRFNCLFCDFPGRASQTFRRPEDVVGEMRHVVERYGVRRFDFVDATFTSEPDFILEMCARIKRAGLRVDWQCFSRPDAFDRVPELALAMRSAGCTWLFMGIESIHNPILARMRRGMTQGVVMRGLRRVWEAGIRVHGNFIIGFPGETEETVRDTATFVRRHPFGEVFFCTFGATQEVLDVAAKAPEKYGHIHGRPSKAWSHDTMDYKTALEWTRWAVREVNRGRLLPVAFSPGTNELDAFPL